MMVERAADQQPVPARVKNADSEIVQSLAILADEGQPEALARLRFETQSTAELAALVAEVLGITDWCQRRPRITSR